MNEQIVLYDHSPINIEGIVNARMQQWFFGIVAYSCAHVMAFHALEILLTLYKILYPFHYYETLLNKPIFSVSPIVSHGGLPIQISTIEWSTQGHYSPRHGDQWNAILKSILIIMGCLDL